jgi:2-dehydro-3-deoxygluconokinase
VSVLTLGEALALLDPETTTAPREGDRLRLRCAGAESNFAIALARLGVDVEWISRLGTDPLGDMILARLTAEGVRVPRVERDRSAPTGLYLKWREGPDTRILYHRAGSAASRLAPAHVPDAALDGVRLVHLTGITTALSETARVTVLDVAARARARGALVTFDPNYRPALWPDPGAALAAQRDVLAHVDWYLCGADEGHRLFGTADEESLAGAIEAAGAGGAVIRVGARGALVRSEGGLIEVPPARVLDVVDEIGAGDGFAAGFVWGLLAGHDPVICVRAANAMAASALGGTGDWETYLRADELTAALAAH